MPRDIDPNTPAQRRRSGRLGRSVIAAIGIDAYAAWPRLSNAVSDALGAARMFGRLGFVEVAPPLLDDAATEDAMRQLLTDRLAQLSPDDNLVLFFAGHGHTHTVDLGDVSVKTGYVLPVDAARRSEQAAANWLRLDSWLSDVARLPPRHILVIIDACHSGVALGSLVKWRAAAPAPSNDLEELRQRRSRRIITSALDDQRAMDTGPYPGHSLFTGCLLEALSGGLANDGRSMATGSELGLYLQRRVSSYPMSTQTPDFGALELDDRGEILIPVVAARVAGNSEAFAPPSASVGAMAPGTDGPDPAGSLTAADGPDPAGSLTAADRPGPAASLTVGTESPDPAGSLTTGTGSPDPADSLTAAHGPDPAGSLTAADGPDPADSLTTGTCSPDPAGSLTAADRHGPADSLTAADNPDPADSLASRQPTLTRRVGSQPAAGEEPPSSPAAPPPHELLVELGRGGMGVVHLARRRDGRLVVIKRLRPEFARNISVRRSFLEEARIASRIKHPNIVEVFGSGYDARGVPWLEMEWAPGVSLQALLDAAPLPRELYAAIIAELLEGLRAAHSVVGEDGKTLDLVHRDVSPHNVVVTYDGHAKIIDFGIAKVRDSSRTTTGVVKGKATYLAPEQAARGPVDARTDLFAVGVMLWQQLAGRRLWEDHSEPEIFHRLVARDIPDLRTAAPEVTGPIVDVVQRALAPEPEARFQTAAELRSALLAACPLAADVTPRLARHVQECFAEQLRELEQLTGAGATPGPLRKPAEGTTARLRAAMIGGRAGDVAWRAVSVVAAIAAIWIQQVRFHRVHLPPEVPVCTTDQACGAGRHCGEDGVCVGLAHDGCKVILPDATAAARPLLLGAMFPLTGPRAGVFGRANAQTAQLAVQEVNQVAGGIPTAAGHRPPAAQEVNQLAGGTSTAGGRRPLGLLLCDSANDAEGRARFLASRVPAVVGFGSSTDALNLARDVFMRRGVLVVASLESSPVLSQEPADPPRLLYRTAASATEFAPPIARAVETMLGPEIRRRVKLAAREKLRVAVVRWRDTTGIAYAEKVMKALEAVPDIEAREVGLGTPDAPENPTIPSAIRELAAQPPHVVITLGDAMFPALIAPLEKQWTTSPRATLYLGATTWEDDEFRAFIAREPAQRTRFFAMSWSTSSLALAGFVERYNESFSDKITQATASAGPYDAVYLLAYAAAAAAGDGGTRIDGAALSRAIARLGPGAPGVAVGPTSIVEGLRRAVRGERIDLQGVLSKLDFDDATGDSPIDANAVVQCTTYDPQTKQIDAADLAIGRDLRTCPGADVDSPAGGP